MQEKFERMFGGAKKSKNESSSSLQRFLDLRRDPASRFKHLRFIMESMPNQSEKKSFVEHHAFEAYHLFHELICQIEYISSQHPGPRVLVQELECALWLLETILCYLPELIAQRWQYNGISLAMKQLLHPQNTIGVRRQAMRLFIQWYQILGIGPYGNQELDPHFSNLVPFLPTNGDGFTTDRILADLCEQTYVRNSFSRRHQFTDASSIGAVSYLAKKPVPFTSHIQMEKSISGVQNWSRSHQAQSYMEKILEFISSDFTKILWSENRMEIQKRCLRHLMEKLRRYYVSTFVTDPASTQLDVFRPKLLSTESSNSGNMISMTSTMADDPLTACRHALIRWVAVYAFSHKKSSDSLNNTGAAEGAFDTSKEGVLQMSPRTVDLKVPPNFDLIRECLFGSKAMVNFVFSMFRESFLLPITYASTMGRVFKTLREWLLMEERPLFFNEPSSPENFVEPFAGLQCAYMSIIYVLASFFYNPYLYKDEERASLLVQISAKILALFKYMVCNSCQLSQDAWQYLLKSLLDIVARNVPISPPVNVDAGHPTLIQRLSGHLFQTLLIAWVYGGLYGCVSNEMWDELLETLSVRTSWPELIYEWGKVMESVTRALGVGVYGVDILDLPLERLSEQKMIKRQGASRGQVGEGKESSSAPKIGNTQPQNDANLAVGKPMYDFVQGSPMSNGPIPQIGQQSSAQTVHRRSDVSASGVSGTVRSKTSSQGAPTRPAISGINALQFTNPDETSLDGTNSVDSSGPTCSSNDYDIHGDLARENLFESELLTANTTSCEDGDDSVSEEFTVAEDVRDLSHLNEEENVHDESVVADCGPATVYAVWRRILGCLGNISQLQKPDLHLGCLELLEQLVINLNKIRDNQNVDTSNQGSITPPSIVPHQTIIAPWLLNTMSLSERFHESKVIAMRLLCRIMVNRNGVGSSIDSSLLAQFLTLLHDCLMSGADEFIGTILTECGIDIFTRIEFDGGTLLLLCDFIRGAGILFSSDGASMVDRIAAVRFLSSIASLPNYLDGQCPCISADWSWKKVRCELIQKEILHILQRLVKSNAENQFQAEAIKGIGFYLADHLSRGQSLQGSPDEESIQILLEMLPVAKADIGLLICDVLEPFRELFPVSEKAYWTNRIVEWLAMAFEATLRELMNFKHGPTDLMHIGQYGTRLALDLIDWCADTSLEQTSSSSSTLAAIISKLTGICYSILLSSHESHRAGTSTANTICRLLLTFLSSNFNQEGITQSYIKDHIIDGMDERQGSGIPHNKPLVLSLNGRAIMSVQQRNTISRLVFRHDAGRRCWDIKRIHRLDSNELSGMINRPFSTWLTSVLDNGDKITEEASQDNSADVANSVNRRDSRDSLERLMRFLNTTSPECFVNSLGFNQLNGDYSITTNVTETSMAGAINQLHLKPKQAGAIETKNQFGQDLNDVGYHFLMGSNGLINWDSHRRMDISALEKNPERVQRELKHLDGLLLKEAHKIAVLYVADGQEDKQSILANDRGSQAFENFVDALGWEIDLKHHCGYAGGLSADVYSTTTYYATSTLETVFHVSTRLPNGDQTKNLRHLGNDEVHIVWSEHWRGYRRSIIATEFCDVLIVIYPLENMPFYKIRIDKRSEIGDFGPLTDGMLVPWSILAPLVRFTAINASRAKRMSVASYKNFYEHRSDSVHQAMELLTSESSYSNLLTSLLRTGSHQQSTPVHKPLVRSN